MDIKSFISKSAWKYDNFKKFGQGNTDINAPWWFLGAIDKMLESTRGSDWSVYKALQPYTEEFWNQVEKVRIERLKEGHDNGVPFNILLDLKSKQTTDYKTDPTMNLESLLSSDRVW
jgi:hypothetical protein